MTSSSADSPANCLQVAASRKDPKKATAGVFSRQNWPTGLPQKKGVKRRRIKLLETVGFNKKGDIKLTADWAVVSYNWTLDLIYFKGFTLDLRSKSLAWSMYFPSLSNATIPKYVQPLEVFTCIAFMKPDITRLSGFSQYGLGKRQGKGLSEYSYGRMSQTIVQVSLRKEGRP